MKIIEKLRKTQKIFEDHRKFKEDSNINECISPVLLDTESTQEQARLSADINGGIYITWEDNNSIAIQHLDSNGNKPDVTPGFQKGKAGQPNITSAPHSFTAWTLTINSPIGYMLHSRTTPA